MKKLLIVFSSCLLSVSTAFSQDDVYYTGDEATVEVKAQTAPPALPVYVQPACPVEGYMWTPGYWAWAPAGYYWVPGVWVAPPRPGLLWTPGYWGWYHGDYGWHHGYWGEHVGYYGGVCYGFGYGGSGFYGGRWEGGAFRYNTAVWHVNTAVVHNTYVSREYVNNNAASRASFNGPGGVKARPTVTEEQGMRQNHVEPTSAQQSHQTMASNDKSAFASANHGRPATTAMSAPNGRHFGQSGHAASGAPGTGNTAHPANATHTTTNNSTTHTAPVNNARTAQPAHTGGNTTQQHRSTNGGQPHSTKSTGRPPQHAAPHNNGGHSGGGGRKGK